MADLFFYGTLCHGPLLSCVLGDDDIRHRITPGALTDWESRWVEDAPFPMIRRKAGTRAPGLILSDVTDAERDRLAYYEAGFDYALEQLPVETDRGTRMAQVFVPAAGRWQAGAVWDLEVWVAQYGALTLAAAREVMERFGQTPPSQIDALFPWIRARAWSRLLAASGAPQTLRRQTHPDDFKVEAERPGFEGFFRMKSFDISHRTFDGRTSEIISRETFVAFDAALVLPYDPTRDEVMLVEQFRFGPVWRGDPAPWVLEPIAGLVDAGEDPADCARREAQEEAGLTLGDLRPMMRVYASPGYSTEFFHCFLGVCDLSARTGGVAGLAEEHEDIRNHIIGFDHAMALVESGEVNTGPLAMMLLGLARIRDDLRRAGPGAHS